MPLRECPCGSGEYPVELYDARGIYAGKVCSKCEREKRAQFRPEIFTDPNYECDEPIDDEQSHVPMHNPYYDHEYDELIDENGVPDDYDDFEVEDMNRDEGW